MRSSLVLTVHPAIPNNPRGHRRRPSTLESNPNPSRRVPPDENEERDHTRSRSSFISARQADRSPMSEALVAGSSLVTREKAAALIDASFPDVDSAELRYLGSGTLYDVFLTADDWAFRFPRVSWSGDLFAPEATFH